MSDERASTTDGPPPTRQSGFGVASCIVAGVQGVLTVIIIVGTVMLTTKGSTEDVETGFMVVGLASFAAIFDHLVGLGLGIAGALQSHRKRVLPILGIILNGSAVLVMLLFLLTGLLVN